MADLIEAEGTSGLYRGLTPSLVALAVRAYT